jgi:hypothetical protein
MAGKTIKEEILTICKPFDISVEDLVQQMIKISKYIGLCPGPERQYDDTEMRSLIEQACPSLWLMDLHKQPTYPTMMPLQVKFYCKLLENSENGKWN